MTTPGVAQPVDRVINAQMIEYVEACADTIVQRERIFRRGLAPWLGPSTSTSRRSVANRGRSRSQVVESTNRLCHSRAGGPAPVTCTFSGPTLVVIDIDVCARAPSSPSPYMLRAPKLRSPKYAASLCRRQEICSPTALPSANSWADCSASFGPSSSCPPASTVTRTCVSPICTSSATWVSTASG